MALLVRAIIVSAFMACVAIAPAIPAEAPELAALARLLGVIWPAYTRALIGLRRSNESRLQQRLDSRL